VILVLSFVFSWVGLMEPWTCNEEPNFFKLPIKELLIRIFRDSTSLSRYFL
jgi:hypothetical protein